MGVPDLHLRRASPRLGLSAVHGTLAGPLAIRLIGREPLITFVTFGELTKWAEIRKRHVGRGLLPHPWHPARHREPQGLRGLQPAPRLAHPRPGVAGDPRSREVPRMDLPGPGPGPGPEREPPATPAGLKATPMSSRPDRFAGS